MMFIWILILVVIGWALWGPGQGGGPWRVPGGSVGGEDSAEAILRERYAGGEIDEETYIGAG